MPTPVPAVPLERRAGRVLLVDATGRVLLLHGGDPSAPERGQWWFTPGGGLEPGEDSAQAAARELAEETGLAVAAEALGKPVHERSTAFAFLGREVRQAEQYFLLRVQAHEVDLSEPGIVVDQGVTGHRWWTGAELRATGEVVFPPELAGLVERLA